MNTTSKGHHYLEELAATISSAGCQVVGAQVGGAPLSVISAGVGLLTSWIVCHNAASVVDLFHERVNLREVRDLVNRKLHADFNDSFLSDGWEATRALHEASALIDQGRPKGVPKRDKRFDCIDSVSLPHGAMDEASIRDCLRILRKHPRPIRVSSTVVCAAVVGVLKSLQKQYGNCETYGDDALDLEIDFEPSNGRDQVGKLIDSARYDFAVVPNDPFFFAQHKKTDVYKLVLPCHGAGQYLFVRKGTEYLHSMRLHVLVESSAELHFRYHPLVRGAEMVPVGDVEEIPNLIENMAGNDGILAWDPLSSHLLHNPAYRLVQRTGHHIYYCLRCHNDWATKKAIPARDAFKKLFVNQWRFCNRHRRRTYSLLSRDREYLNRFARGAGITRHVS